MLIKDLGLTDFNGKLKRKRIYYLIQCNTCRTLFTVRKDAYKSDHCFSCNSKKANREKANSQIAKGVKTCSMCKKELPLYSFGKKSNMLSGYRSNCKQCEKSVYAETRKTYTNAASTKLRKQAYDKKYTQLPCNKERRKKVQKQWAQNNKAKQKAISDNDRHKRRLLKKDSTLTTKELLAWETEQTKVCSYCGVFCANTYHIDHIEPLSLGGKHELDNLTIACPSCNSSKNNKPLLLWLLTKTVAYKQTQ